MPPKDSGAIFVRYEESTFEATAGTFEEVISQLQSRTEQQDLRI
jgi:hypothetical protein